MYELNIFFTIHLSHFLFGVQGVVKIVHALNYHKHVVNT